MIIKLQQVLWSVENVIEGIVTVSFVYCKTYTQEPSDFAATNDIVSLCLFFVRIMRLSHLGLEVMVAYYTETCQYLSVH
jgi:hypothetical protein